MTGDKDAMEALRRIGTSTIGGVLDQLGVGAILPGLKPIAEGLRLAGPAFTVKAIAGALGTFAPEDFDIGAYIDGAAAGEVIAIDNGGEPISMLGGIAAMAARARGIEGIVVDGGVRDRDEIAGSGLAVFPRHVVPISGRTRVKILATGTAIRLDGALVRPGDVLVGDGTGVVCLPGDAVPEVLARASALEARDRRAQDAVRQGLGFKDAMARASKPD